MSQRKIALKIFAPSTVICSVFGLVISLISGLSSSPASADVDLAEYRQFLADNTHQTAADMQAHYGSDVFREAANIDLSKAAFADSVIRHYGLTTYEQQLLGRHGFVVTERVHPRSFGQGFLDVYNADLPVFISTDAVLHALHMSYDAILRDLESQILMPRLQRALQAMHATLPAMAEGYADQPAMTPMLGDVDVYLTVARRLAGGARGEPVASGVFAQTDDVVGDLLTAMNRRSLESVELFGALRAMDFSQFKPRGHYAQDPELTRYFGAMMWLGRVEFYLDAPSGANLPEEVLARQTLDAVLLDDLILQSGAAADLEEIDRLLTGFVGTPDNLTLAELRQVRADTGLQDPVELLNAGIVADFRARAAVTGSQQILSQVILRDPLAADGLANALAAPAFLLLGQRFLIDSYIFANVVYDKIRHDGQPVFRGLPSSLDALFALGNDTAVQLLDDELTQFRYAPNLAALRYLVDAQEPAFWELSLYNGWLQSIRALNPPRDRSGLPPFMQTQAWWLQKINTQLAAWAQLRHDNLLYGKSSYTAGIVCFYPATYVEPVPEFFVAVRRFAERAQQILGGAPDDGDAAPIQQRIARYFGSMAAIADTLGTVARKELTGKPFSEAENLFLQTVVYEEPSCGVTFGGWYTRLFYGGAVDMTKRDMVIADVHTQPTDASGAVVGKVLHVGTGPLDLAVVVAEVPGRGSFAFAGPLLSFQEHVTVGFERLTDEQWQAVVDAAAPSFRPDLVNLYLANPEGDSRGAPRLLATTVGSLNDHPDLLPGRSSPDVESASHPNPFNGQTLISFRVGTNLAGQHVTLTIHNSAGQAIRTLLNEALPGGAYSVRWHGVDEAGVAAASGTYLYRLQVGQVYSGGTMTLVR